MCMFAVPTKAWVAKKFEHFLVHFEKRFNCRAHLFRTDGGREYPNVDLFCKRTSVVRQVIEPAEQASNGKAERMHRTVMNILRCMIFGSGIALTYWSGAVEYAAYVLNWNQSRANPKRASPSEILTRMAPSLRFKAALREARSIREERRDQEVQDAARQGRKVIVTRRVTAIETLGEAANAQLRRVLDAESEAEH
ncbi:hypothetical protein PybrP1_004042 [[Pythium] brassicae (nom. inval.)]|nr:hypothetical protein PybrP1_004042 [[Pythium] brassicae (nom. inval.)]